MEGDRIAYAEESGSSLGKQRKLIKILTRERNNLLNDYRVVVSENHKRKDDAAVARINFLIVEHEKLKETIKQIKLDMDEIDYQIAKVEKQTKNVRSKQMTDEQCKERTQSARKTLKILENKLETAVKRFCTLLSENKQLREEIDGRLKER